MKTVKLIVLSALMAVSAGQARPAAREIYPDPVQAKADLAAALKTAAASHKRILLDFGGNWCGDCQVLDLYFHNPANRPILEANFVLVIIGAIFNHWGAMAPVLWVLAVLSTITVAHRIVYTYQNTKHLAPTS